MGLFDRFRKQSKQTNDVEDDFDEVMRKAEEIKREQERKREEVERRARETDAMLSSSIKRMNTIANGPDAQSIRSSDVDYLNKILGKNQGDSDKQALIDAAAERLKMRLSEKEEIEKKKVVDREVEPEKTPKKEQAKYVPDFSDDRLFLMAHGVSIVDNSPEFINQFYGILKEFGHYGYGTNRYPSLETSLAIANNLKSLRDSGADIDMVLLLQAEKNKKEKETRKSKKADYTRELEQMLDDKSTGKVERKDTNNFKY